VWFIERALEGSVRIRVKQRAFLLLVAVAERLAVWLLLLLLWVKVSKIGNI
jgi:hypothetical protein